MRLAAPAQMKMKYWEIIAARLANLIYANAILSGRDGSVLIWLQPESWPYPVTNGSQYQEPHEKTESVVMLLNPV